MDQSFLINTKATSGRPSTLPCHSPWRRCLPRPNRLSALLTSIEAELADRQAQQERHQRQPSAAPPKEHPLVVVVVAAARLPRAVRTRDARRFYRRSIRVSICERARHFIQGGRRACAVRRVVLCSINKPTTTETFAPPRLAFVLSLSSHVLSFVLRKRDSPSVFSLLLLLCRRLMRTHQMSLSCVCPPPYRAPASANVRIYSGSLDSLQLTFRLLGRSLFGVNSLANVR